MAQLNTCRLCKDNFLSADLVRYGSRHYAHPECYLKSGKPLVGLNKWELDRIPYQLLKQYNRLDEMAIAYAEATRHITVTAR